MMMPLNFPEPLPSLVARKFKAAKESGALLFSETELTTISWSNIPFQVRYCPALATKEIRDTAATTTTSNKSKPDPFENPPSELLISELPYAHPQPSHILVLNKFPVIPNHFILATKSYQPQDYFLEKADLQATLACLSAWEESGDETKPRRLFAFFNSGKNSGASQPHRHIQFLPVADMAGTNHHCDDNDEGSWVPLIEQFMPPPPSDEPHQSALLDIPFACYGQPLRPDMSADELHRIYLELYTQAVRGYLEFNHDSSSSIPSSLSTNPTSTTNNPASLSYNLAMTTTAMVLCPREKDVTILPLGREATLPREGLVSVNGTILAGTLLVKMESELEAIKRDPELLKYICLTTGIPRKGGVKAVPRYPSTACVSKLS